MNDNLLVTCLIPAFNEAPRIGSVLDAAVGHPKIARVLVIDDGSTDGTVEIACQKGAEVLRLSGNHGKTLALAQGLRQVKGGHILLLDADLTGLSARMLDKLIAPVARRETVVALSLRGNAPVLWRLIGLDYITGERLLPYELIAPEIDRLNTLPRFGFEVFLNQLTINAACSVAVVRWPSVASPSKVAKRGLRRGIADDAAMMADIFRCVGIRDCLRQILRLHTLSRPVNRTSIKDP